MLSAGGIRQQFSIRENIEMSLYGIDFLRSLPHEVQTPQSRPFCFMWTQPRAGNHTHTPTHSPPSPPPPTHQVARLTNSSPAEHDVQLHEHGYLLLASTAQGDANLRANNAVQHAAGADWITLLRPDEIERRFPWCRTDDLTLGAFGERNEGYFDPWCFLNGLRAACRQLGVTTVNSAAVGMSASSGPAPGAPSPAASAPAVISAVHTADGQTLACDRVVVAAGAWSARVVDQMRAALAPHHGVADVPVRRRKRSVFHVHCAQDGAADAHAMPPASTPLVVDPSGVWFRPEAGRPGAFICGVSPDAAAADPDCEGEDDACHLERPDHAIFEDRVWPALYERVPRAFGALRMGHMWAGYYDYNTLDQNAIIDHHPDVRNAVVATGFSGHGLQQAPATGRAVAELVLEGRFCSLDLGKFGYGRILRGEPFLEANIV